MFLPQFEKQARLLALNFNLFTTANATFGANNLIFPNLIDKQTKIGLNNIFIYSETDFEGRKEIVGIMSDRENGFVPSYQQNNIFKPVAESEFKTENAVLCNDKSIAAAKKLLRLTQKNPNLKFSRKLGVSLFHWSENSGEAAKYRALRKAFENENIRRENRMAEKAKNHSVGIKKREKEYEIGM